MTDSPCSDLLRRYTEARGALQISNSETVATLESVVEEIRDFECDDPTWLVYQEYCIEAAERSFADARASAQRSWNKEWCRLRRP
jgi:hypothetical protein